MAALLVFATIRAVHFIRKILTTRVIVDRRCSSPADERWGDRANSAHPFPTVFSELKMHRDVVRCFRTKLVWKTMYLSALRIADDSSLQSLAYSSHHNQLALDHFYPTCEGKFALA